MKERCMNCEFYHEQSIGNVCRLDFNHVEPDDHCDRYEPCEECLDWKTIKHVTIIILILIGISSLALTFIMQIKVAEYTDNFWIIWGVGFIFFCPVVNLIITAIRELNEVIK